MCCLFVQNVNKSKIRKVTNTLEMEV